jgi:hypothetical protein
MAKKKPLTPMEFKTLENKLRRMAARQGFTLSKSRLRDPRALGYGGYQIERDNVIVAGGQSYQHMMSLDEVEAWLLSEPERRRTGGRPGGS